MNLSGIYAIRNTITGYSYIGSTHKKIKYRWNTHQNRLNKGVHVNTYLQNAWNKYGSDAFCFEVLEEITDLSTILVREQYWLDITELKYNLRPLAESNKGHKFSEESRKRISQKLKGHSVSKETREKLRQANLGKKHSDETRKKLEMLLEVEKHLKILKILQVKDFKKSGNLLVLKGRE